jgi:hypothetical protein
VQGQAPSGKEVDSFEYFSIEGCANRKICHYEEINFQAEAQISPKTMFFFLSIFPSSTLLLPFLSCFLFSLPPFHIFSPNKIDGYLYSSMVPVLYDTYIEPRLRATQRARSVSTRKPANTVRK